MKTPVHGFGPGQPRRRPRSSGAAERLPGAAPPGPGPSPGPARARLAAGLLPVLRARAGLAARLRDSRGRAREERGGRRRAPPHLPAPAPRPAPPPSPGGPAHIPAPRFGGPATPRHAPTLQLRSGSPVGARYLLHNPRAWGKESRSQPGRLVLMASTEQPRIGADFCRCFG